MSAHVGTMTREVLDADGDDSFEATSSASNKRKRLDPGGEISKNSRKASQLAPQISTRDIRSFACPLYKKNPLEYKKCSSFETKRISHLKQHITRTHSKVPFCARCLVTFQDTASCHDHIRQKSCQKSALFVEPDGITEEQRKALSYRVPSTKKITREQQWFCVFDIVCPRHQPRPLSPYHESTMCEGIIAQIRDCGLQIFIASLRQEEQWPLGLDASLLEPVLSMAWSHTFDHLAAIGSGSEARQEDNKGNSTGSSASAESSNLPASSPGPSKSADEEVADAQWDVSAHLAMANNYPNLTAGLGGVQNGDQMTNEFCWDDVDLNALLVENPLEDSESA